MVMLHRRHRSRADRFAAALLEGAAEGAHLTAEIEARAAFVHEAVGRDDLMGTMTGLFDEGGSARVLADRARDPGTGRAANGAGRPDGRRGRGAVRKRLRP